MSNNERSVDDDIREYVDGGGSNAIEFIVLYSSKYIGKTIPEIQRSINELSYEGGDSNSGK